MAIDEARNAHVHRWLSPEQTQCDAEAGPTWGLTRLSTGGIRLVVRDHPLNGGCWLSPPPLGLGRGVGLQKSDLP